RYSLCHHCVSLAISLLVVRGIAFWFLPLSKPRFSRYKRFSSIHCLMWSFWACSLISSFMTLTNRERDKDTGEGEPARALSVVYRSESLACCVVLLVCATGGV